VGAGIPDELWVYRLKKLKQLGVNAIRSSHNPATPAMLNICDSMGFYVIDENRLMGINDYHYRQLRNMIFRDRNHPCIILWSIGNEEWQIEGNEKGERIARRMQQWAHQLDSTRFCTYGNSGGFGIVKVTDIHGYNYIVQNDVDNRRKTYPDWFVVGTEETTGCGTRNVYETDSAKGWMAPINYMGEERTGGEKNVIERGWKFYRDHNYAGGLFYWTGFDYKGEPNPMKWPSTGSEKGILDYCGFPKDEAYYLKAAWTNEPILHLFPHWNLKGKEGKKIEVWAYSNMDEVELFVNGKSMGRQRAKDRDSHFVWQVVYQPGKVKAVGYRNGKRILTTIMETTDEATTVKVEKTRIGSLTVYDLTLCDKRGREVPDACNSITVACNSGTKVLGWGNGDPAYKDIERPKSPDSLNFSMRAFMGKAQIIVRDDTGLTFSLE
jgi:beta-galactosidase